MEDLWIWLTVLLGGGGVIVAVVATVLAGLCTLVPFVAIGWFIWDRAKKRDAIRQSALGWQATTGRVIKSRVEVSSGGQSTSVSPRVYYAFDLNGRTYQGSQIQAGDSVMRTGGSQNAYQTVDRYPEGAIVTIYYNPQNPEESALER
jgi:hypothetical protein